MRYRIGDIIVCKIRGNSVVGADFTKFDTELKFEIIGTDPKKYLIFIPPFYNINGSWIIKDEYVYKFNIDPGYVNERGMLLGEERVCRSVNSNFDGLFCNHCNEFYPMAEGNQPDGTLICYQCRSDPYR